MAIWNIPPGGMPDRHSLDLECAALIKAGAPGSVVAVTLRKYFPLAYVTAAGILRSRVSAETLADEAAELALRTMETLILRAEGGTLGFSGSGSFSAYLARSLQFAYKASVRIDYPVSIRRGGMKAMTAYRMVLAEGYDRATAIRLLAQEFSLRNDEAARLVDAALSFHERESEKDRRRPGKYRHTSLERHPRDAEPTPEEGLILKDQLRIVAEAVDRLAEPAASVIRGFILEGRWKTLADMEADLGLTNGSYELKKAKEELRRLIT